MSLHSDYSPPNLPADRQYRASAVEQAETAGSLVNFKEAMTGCGRPIGDDD
jgi:hypothetical protein